MIYREILYRKCGSYMARPRKRKRVCREPNINTFGPYLENTDIVIDNLIGMSVEEFETIRLIDYEDFTQEECAEAMGVGRSTVQRLYETARGKLADCIVNGKTLKIEGGDYRLCSELEELERCNRCYKNRHRRGRGI